MRISDWSSDVCSSDLKELGYKGSRNTVARWAAKRRARHNPQVPDRQQTRAAWKAPSRRRCAWYLSQAPDQLDAEIARFLDHHSAQAPEPRPVADQAVRFHALARKGAREGIGGDSRI